MSRKGRSQEITHERLLQLVEFNAETGVFIRKFASLKGPNARHVGSVLDAPHKAGYKRCSINSITYLSHRLAWFYAHGQWPDVIDHINRDKTDNRIVNLRNVTLAINSQNSVKPLRNNTSGIRGVCWCKARRKWKAKTTLDGKSVNLGYFHSQDEARSAYLAARAVFHPWLTP